MPIHPIDEPSRLRVETNVAGKWVNLEDTDYRHNEYKRNQQTEPRRKYVLEPLPGTEPQQLEPESIQTDAAPVEDKEITKALKKDLNKRGPPEVKTPKPKTKKTLD